jgi:conjugal transfer/type IV secretion protein DotA/TraY
MTTGIGAGFLATILGAETFSRINFEIGGQTQAGGGSGSFSGSENPAFHSLLQFGAYLGAALTSLLVIFHGFIMVFNKMEYGDVMGEARERFIGFIRAALAFGLVMPIAAGGLSSAQYAVGYVAVASNGIGNKAAETVMLAGFGAQSSPLNMFNVNHATSPEASAQVFADMVGQQSCLSYMKAISATPTETREMCAASAIGSAEEGNEFNVGYDGTAIAEMTDEAFCEENNSGFFGGGGSSSTAFMRNACTGVRHAQREAYEQIRDLYNRHDGNIESEEAQAELEQIAGGMQSVIANTVGEINSAIRNEVGGTNTSGTNTSGTTYLAGEMAGFVNEAGWPGLGLIYSTIGSQMDAVSGLQSMNGTPSVGFSIDRLQAAGRQANSAIRIAQSDAASGAAASVSTVPDGSSSAEGSMLGSTIMGSIGDGIYSMAESINVGGQEVMQFLFSPAFEDPGPAATYKIGSTVLGGVMITALAADFMSMLPAGRVLGGAADFGKAIQTGLSKISSKGKDGDDGWFDGGSIILNLLIIYISALLMLTLLVATFLVLILPKIPVFLVAFLALEWAIWCAIVIFGAPLWVALNMTVIGNQPGIFTQRALSGLGVLLYIILFPTMVVAGVVISVLAYNLIIPVLSMMLLLAFGGGLVEMILGIFAMPFIMLVTLMIGAFVSITAISRIPHMITNYLGVSAPGGSVSESINNFIASPTSFNNTSNPQGMMQSGGKAMMGKGAKS